MMSRYIIEQAAELCMATNNVPCLIGYTGVGKTDMGSIIARRNNRNVIELNLALHSTEDLIGYPYKADDGKMHWAPPAWFPEEENKYILYVDEINRASKDVLNAIMPMLLTGKLHEHSLPEGTWIMSAMNPDNDDFDMVYSFDDAAVISRLVFIEVPPEFNSWKKWLKNNNKHDDVIVDFLKKNPKYFVPEIKNVISQNIRPNPRSWTKFINILQYCKANRIKPLEALDLICKGLLGDNINIHMAILLDSYFEDVSFDSVFDYDLENENALAMGNLIIQNLNTGKTFPNEELCAKWFNRNAKTHPAIIRRILTEVDDGLTSIYAYNDFLEAVSYVTSH